MTQTKTKVVNALGTMALVIIIAAQWGAILYWVYGHDEVPQCQACPEPAQPLVDEEEPEE